MSTRWRPTWWLPPSRGKSRSRRKVRFLRRKGRKKHAKSLSGLVTTLTCPADSALAREGPLQGVRLARTPPAFPHRHHGLFGHVPHQAEEGRDGNTGMATRVDSVLPSLAQAEVLIWTCARGEVSLLLPPHPTPAWRWRWRGCVCVESHPQGAQGPGWLFGRR